MYNHCLDTFCAVAETGSFAQAAEKLYITKAGVMIRINSLEEDLGVVLFNRSSKGVTLTDYGKYLYFEAQNMINHSFMVRDQIKHVCDNINHVIRVGFSLLNPLGEFTRIWHRSPRFGEFSLSLISFPSNLNMMISKSIESIQDTDIGFCLDSNIDPLVPTETVFFDQYSVCCAIPYSHPLASEKQLSPEDLKGETIVLPYKTMPEFSTRFIEAIKEKWPDITIEAIPQFYDLELVNRCAEEKKILLSMDCWDHVHPGMKNLRVNWKWKVPYGLIYKKDARPEVLEFIEAFKEAMTLKDK
jgi:DNA-binding transcriptional LysR family regulator